MAPARHARVDAVAVYAGAAFLQEIDPLLGRHACGALDRVDRRHGPARPAGRGDHPGSARSGSRRRSLSATCTVPGKTAASIPALAAHAHRMTTGPAWWTAAELPFVGRPFEIAPRSDGRGRRSGRDGIPALLEVADDSTRPTLRTGPSTVDLAAARQRGAEARARRSKPCTVRSTTLRLAVPRSSWLPAGRLRPRFARVNPALGHRLRRRRRAHRRSAAGACSATTVRSGTSSACRTRPNCAARGGLPGAFAIVGGRPRPRSGSRISRATTPCCRRDRPASRSTPAWTSAPDYRQAYGASGPTAAVPELQPEPALPVRRTDLGGDVDRSRAVSTSTARSRSTPRCWRTSSPRPDR